MNCKNLIEFLVYVFFGIVPSDLFKELYFGKEETYEKYCIKKIIMKAYGDATNQGAYNALFSKKKDKKNQLDKIYDLSEKAKRTAANHILEKITNLNIEQFDNWHKDICDEIVKCYKNVVFNNKKLFTYGNAQKWVNMTIKYICLLDIYCGEYAKNIEKIKSCLHVPIDRYILKVLTNEKTNEKWSKIDDYGDYMSYIILSRKKNHVPIEWEHVEWIKQSEIFKEKNKTKKYNSFWQKGEKQ